MYGSDKLDCYKNGKIGRTIEPIPYTGESEEFIVGCGKSRWSFLGGTATVVTPVAIVAKKAPEAAKAPIAKA